MKLSRNGAIIYDRTSGEVGIDLRRLYLDYV